MPIEVMRIEVEFEIPEVRFPVAQFDLHVEVGGYRILTIDIVDVVIDVVVGAPSIALVVKAACAEGQAIVECGNDAFPSESALVARNTGSIELDFVALKHGGEFVEPGVGWTAARDDVQLGFADA